MITKTLEEKQSDMKARLSEKPVESKIVIPIESTKPCQCGRVFTSIYKQCDACRSKSKVYRSTPEFRAKRKASPSYMRDIHQGMTPEQYTGMLASQSQVCAICGHPEPEKSRFKRLCVDHDHTCKHRIQSCALCRRGLLCSPCNRSLGQAEDLLLFIIHNSIDFSSLADFRKQQIAYLTKYVNHRPLESVSYRPSDIISHSS